MKLDFTVMQGALDGVEAFPSIALWRALRMIPRVKPEGMLFGKPLHTFPDHALGSRHLHR